MMKEPTYTFCVPEFKSGVRLDKFLADGCVQISRSRIKSLIIGGWVYIDNKLETSPSSKVKKGSVCEIFSPPIKNGIPKPQDIPLDILFEDDYLIVINKPVGLVVHPGAGNPDGTIVNALLAHCADSLSGIGGVYRPGIVHRLDKDTSGVLVVAKTDQAHQSLSKQFSEHTVQRAYQAILWGVPSKVDGVIKSKIGRSPTNRKKMSSVSRGGKESFTKYHLIKSFGSVASLVECRLMTGRTHQIRVHMSEIGHAVVGDPIYGVKQWKRIKALDTEDNKKVFSLKQQALHAYTLGFKHPVSEEYLQLDSEPRTEIKDLIKILEKLN